jgi:hypothetical protein
MNSPSETTFPGFEQVKDLIPDGLFLHCSEMWRICVEHYRDESDDLRQRMILEMTPDIRSSSTDRVAVIMEHPTQITLPDSHQIMGLCFRDIQSRGLEEIYWHASDYESSGFEVYCKSVRFERRKHTEPGGAPKAR